MVVMWRIHRGFDRRLLAIVLICLAFGGFPAWADEKELETQVQEIEHLAVTAPWRESSERIEALAPRRDELTPAQRQRLEYVRLRNLALAGDQRAALAGLDALLKEDVPTKLRVPIYATAISIAANLGEWTQAFNWLSEGLSHLQSTSGQSHRLFSVASYLHTLVGETAKAKELALRAVKQVEADGGDPRELCRVVGDVALAEDHAHNYSEAEAWRRRQIEACTRAGDPVFIANGNYGIGKMAAAQGRHAEALQWAHRALAEFEAVGFEAGIWSTRLVIAGSLIATNQQPGRAKALLDDTLAYYQRLESNSAIAETEHLLARLAEQSGDVESAYSHLKRAATASESAKQAEHQRRLAYLQVEFDLRSKERQIELLEAENQVAALQASATQRRQLALALGMAALVVIALLLLMLLRRTFAERRRYRWQSERDSLTRLYNYQQVRKLGNQAFAQARAHGLPFTAIVTDIDLFKQVNDQHGHAAGDEALRSLGVWINEVIGSRDIAGRSGGDEFTVLIQGDATEAGVLLQRLRNRIEPINVFDESVRFSISSGVCQADGNTATLEQLIHQADRALYQAKHEGRDRVVHVDAAGDQASMQTAGLVVVGSGIQFGRHVSERCLSEIREAQVVFCLADAFTLAMIRGFRPDAINLGTHYAPGKDRRQTYREIDAAIMTEVSAGKRVCAVFYGHPGVFADVPHRVIRKTRELGLPARMEPGISAEACLYADLGMDPGLRGVQSMEATHFLVYDRQPDTAGLVLLWQVALSGDLSCTRLHAQRDGLQALVDKLQRWYPPGHEVILYEAARLPIESPRIERMPLRDLPDAHYQEYTTLVIPPLGALKEAPEAAGDSLRTGSNSPSG